jgi:predicted DNA-binding transcriptional regulator AlpA
MTTGRIPPLLKVAGVAHVLGVHQSTIHAQVRAGAFPIDVRMIGSTRYFRTVDVEQYIGRAIAVEDLTA